MAGHRQQFECVAQQSGAGRVVTCIKSSQWYDFLVRCYNKHRASLAAITRAVHEVYLAFFIIPLLCLSGCKHCLCMCLLLTLVPPVSFRLFVHSHHSVYTSFTVTVVPPVYLHLQGMCNVLHALCCLQYLKPQ